jgi:hypothetical protein
VTRQKHHRVRDHFGVELATDVVIDEAVGPYPARTTVEDVLAGILERLTALESSDHVLATFTLDAYLLAPGFTVGTGTPIGVMTLDAIARATVASDFTLDAALSRGGSFTLDAWIQAYGRFTLDAWIL